VSSRILRIAGIVLLMATAIPPSSCSQPTPRDGDGPGPALSNAGGSIRIDVPVPETFRLDNGLQVWLLRNDSTPLATFALVIRGGSSLDPPGKEGLASLTATMLDEGAAGRGPLEIAEQVDFLGAQLEIETEREYAHVSLEVLEKNLDAALAIVSDIVERPDFRPTEWERVKTLWVNDLIQRREEPREVSRIAAERAFYGEGHPHAHPIDGYESSVRRVELDDVKKHYSSWFRPPAATLIFTGNVAPADLRKRLEKTLGSWKATGPEPPGREKPAQPRGEPRWVLVDKPGAPQTEVRLLLPAPAQGDPAAAPLTLANMALGGTFTSRLMSNLRERQKITYGAASSFTSRSSTGHIAAASAVHAERTATAIIEFCRELRLIGEGTLADEEVRKVRSSIATRVLEALETQVGAVEVYLESAALGLPASERGEFYRALASAPPAEIASAARAYFRWDRATVALVGDRKVIEAQLAETSSSGAFRDVVGAPLVVPPIEIRGREGEDAPR
jgi:zinc protease